MTTFGVDNIMADIDLSDIQGVIVRDYGLPFTRFIVLRLDAPAAARRFFAALVSGKPDLAPQITSAVIPSGEPSSCLNVGLTYDGLRALGLSKDSLASFPKEFIAGALGRATTLGDTGASAPENWIGQLNTTSVHAILAVYARDEDTLTSVSDKLRALFAQGGAATELSSQDGRPLPDGRIHFGYVDGISQPIIEGITVGGLATPVPPSPPGSMLLGYPSQFPPYQFPAPQPDDLGKNGSFAAYRVLEQQVAEFEDFLAKRAPEVGLDVETLAAKICGRWRNGIPLTMSPTTPDPSPPIDPSQINNFSYKATDNQGYACPIGAHIRRTHPRDSLVAGGGGNDRPIMRRTSPYGPPFDPKNPHDGIPRGLLGFFIGASLAQEFEFIMTQWINADNFGLQGDLDPLLGNVADPTKARFVIQAQPANKTICGFSRFVITRGSAYCFLPSFTAVRNHIAAVE